MKVSDGTWLLIISTVIFVYMLLIIAIIVYVNVGQGLAPAGVANTMVPDNVTYDSVNGSQIFFSNGSLAVRPAP